MTVESMTMVVVGVALMAAGVGTVTFRDRVAAKNKVNIEKKVERLLPGFGSYSTPGRMAIVGLGLIAIGVILAFKGITR